MPRSVRQDHNAYTIVQFPEAGSGQYPDIYRILWQHWLKMGDRYAKEQFDKYYPQWRDALRNKADAPSLHGVLLERMLDGGVAALPFIIDEIDRGDDRLVPVVAELTKGRGSGLRSDATRADRLGSWKENKGKWIIVPLTNK